MISLPPSSSTVTTWKIHFLNLNNDFAIKGSRYGPAKEKNNLKDYGFSM
jgi:hypothetical protein